MLKKAFTSNGSDFISKLGHSAYYLNILQINSSILEAKVNELETSIQTGSALPARWIIPGEIYVLSD